MNKSYNSDTNKYACINNNMCKKIFTDPQICKNNW